MKTKKLIELLQKADPEGTGEVCIPTQEGNVDIFNLEWKEGYWDGPYQVLIRDWDNPYYNVVGAELRSDGNKLCIKTISIEDALLSDPDLPVKIVDIAVHKTLQDRVSRWRDETKEIHKKQDNRCLVEVLNQVKTGKKIIQNKKDKIGLYNVMYYLFDNKKDQLNQGSCGAVLKSGFFKPVEKDDFIEWEFIL